MLIYEALNKEVIQSIPSGVKRILDLGCGDGSMGAYLKSTGVAEVTGITYSEKEAVIARTKIDRVIVADLNEVELQALGKFDCVICSHVLEHLYDPGQLLQKIKAQLTENGIVIIALPNILYWKERLKFLKGSFKYTEGGLMDKTHFRFFDWKTANALISDSGIKIITRTSSGALPLPLIRKIVPGKILRHVDSYACKSFPGLFGFQFVFTGTVK